MAKQGSPLFGIAVSSVSGTTAASHSIANYVDTIGGVKLTPFTAETHAFGDTWVERMKTGVFQLEPFTLGGFYDDLAATGPNQFFGNVTDLGTSRRMELNFATSSDILNFAYILLSYTRTPTRNELTRFEAEIGPTGTVVTTT